MRTEYVTSNVKSVPSGVLLQFTIEGIRYEQDITLAVDHVGGSIDWRVVTQLLIQKGFNTVMATNLSVTFERQADIRESTACAEYRHPFAKFIGQNNIRRRK
jgi:hypothetical protein